MATYSCLVSCDFSEVNPESELKKITYPSELIAAALAFNNTLVFRFVLCNISKNVDAI